ncbi:hypothetical protein [Amycolatopsis sp. NPDC003731]
MKYGFVKRSAKALALATALLSAVSMTTATPAQASIVQVWDSVEGATPWTRWQGGGSGDGVAGYDLNGGVARSGANDGWLYVGNGWAANRIPVNISNWNRGNCAVGVWFNPLTPAGAQVGLQIWNPDGWRIIAETYPWFPGGGYRQAFITGLDLRGFTGDIYLQVIYGNGNGTKTFVRFDDMAIQCSF